MKYVELEELYDWLPVNREADYPGQFDNDRHYQLVPNELHSRLQEAYNQIRSISEEVELLRKK